MKRLILLRQGSLVHLISAQAAQGRFLSQLRQYLRRQGIQHIRADDAGGHAVDPDVSGGQLHGQGPGLFSFE